MGCSPGGSISNMMISFINGDLILSVLMTMVNTFLSMGLRVTPGLKTMLKTLFFRLEATRGGTGGDYWKQLEQIWSVWETTPQFRDQFFILRDRSRICIEPSRTFVDSSRTLRDFWRIARFISHTARFISHFNIIVSHLARSNSQMLGCTFCRFQLPPVLSWIASSRASSQKIKFLA